MGAPTETTPGTYTLNSQGQAEDFFIQLTGGTNALVGSYSPNPVAPNNSYTTSQGTATIIVTQAATTIGLAASQTTVASGAPVTLTATVSTQSLGLAPSGAVRFLNSGVPITGTPTYTYVNATSSSFASTMAALTTSFTANASITAQYVADSNYLASTTTSATAITITNGAADFSVIPSPNSFNISAPGASGSTTIGLTALNGFTGTVTLSCSVPAAMLGSCSLASTSLTLTSAAPANSTTLYVNTTAPSTVIGLFNIPRWLLPIGGVMLAAFFLLLIPAKQRRLKLAFGSLFLVLLAAAMVACGGGSSTTTPTSPGTPTGSYTVTVTGVNGSLTSSTNVTVTVQ